MRALSVEYMEVVPYETPPAEDEPLFGECLILDPVSTPKSTPLPSLSDQVSLSRASNGSNPKLPESNSKGDGAGNPGMPLDDLLDQENGDDGAYVRGIVEELLPRPSRDTFP
ncbi:hypothetical protein K469DRAFT_689370 [Zopfia rhizophila CBS 207.26]|uniref:Uncharacterized protein n=1 Tax=Zopfia rhizophila CBS 207.26 TaxID=1314779 RepID=A0A6A6ES25_9PEZI|nr:hypothetical protein K469DRAFT_689370 [Zopfia rhizophila CBS 207.26]